MAQRMLIDTTHPEETRVAVISGNRLDDLDYETSTKKQLKGNIYLARVVRVEPSLQACFVDYGGNRHGFLAFSEIHPDYYRIPVSDREALLAEQAAAARAEEEEYDRAEREQSRREARGGNGGGQAAPAEDGQGGEHPHDAEQGYDAHGDDDRHDDEHREGDHAHDDHGAEEREGGRALSEPETVNQPVEVTEVGGFDPAALDVAPEQAGRGAPPTQGDLPLADQSFADHQGDADAHRADESSDRAGQDNAAPEFGAEPQPAALRMDAITTRSEPMGDDEDDQPEGEAETGREGGEGRGGHRRRGRGRDGRHGGGGDRYESFGGDATDEMPRRRSRPLRNYKIQEVIKRRQIMLIQVVKEERGNKGAALTTYLSLAGRYCVLMPNTTRGGGVSRKITNTTDRRRLKTLLDDLDLPQGMAVIVRTAGSERSRAEVKRDCDYLMRLWDEIREMTLKSTAPCLIYEEASLIKRAIRDLYARDIDEVLVEGEDGYRAAKDFMKMLMPSHAKRVQPYREEIPLFHRYQIESQIDAMHSPSVQLRSGGYIVINPTEALVAIDVNSGRATRERFIEETALRTNLEAAEEVGRQLRLRDLGGLIVIDFIDMEDHRNNHAVERRLKESLRFDRARIQVGRISPFGLLELSRQRLRPSITETSTMPCPHCAGTGLIRSTESAALHVLRAIEEEGIRRRSREIVVHVATQIALYILNEKRQRLSDIERRYGLLVMIAADESLIPPDYRLERLRAATGPEGAAPIRAESVLPSMAEDLPEELEEIEAEVDEQDEAEPEAGERSERPMDRQPDRPSDRQAADGENGEGGERRRRRRRRGRNRGRDGEPRDGQGQGREGNGQDRAPRQGFAPNGEGEGQPMGEAPSEFARGDDHRPDYANDEPAGEAGEGPGREMSPRGDGPRAEGDDDESGDPRRRRRRGRRGGRRRGRRGDENGGPVEGAEARLEGEPRGDGDQAEEGRGGRAPGNEAPWPVAAGDQTPMTGEGARAESAWPLSHEHDKPPATVVAEPPRYVPEPPRYVPESVAPQAAAPQAAAPVVPPPAPPVAERHPEPAPAEPRAPDVARAKSSAPANVVVVDEATPKPEGKRGWWQRLTQG